MAPPLVTAVVPVYNGAAFLAECLGSLLAQDYEALEIVVVDDGSTDGSAAIADGFDGVRVLRRGHTGLGATRNVGVHAGNGAFIGFCDADDVWKPQKARVQAAYLLAHPEVDLVLCRQDTVFEDGAAHPDWLLPDQARGDLDGVSPTSALFRRAVFDRIRFRTDMESGTDFNLLVQARTAGLGMALLEESLRVRRIHDDNMTTRVGAAMQPMFQTVREHLRERR
ncbi:MAG TPA: glycosyltransferase family A protein [Acidimicrobiia bacterium]|nr:glycosyltransferase family A protein [Acidimicrobiia bacterium]